MSAQKTSFGRLAFGVITLALGTAGAALFLQSVFASPQSAGPWVSTRLWQSIVESLGGESRTVIGNTSVSIPFVPVLLRCLSIVAVIWALGATWIRLRGRQAFVSALADFAILGGVVLLALAGLDLVRALVPAASPWIQATSHLWFSFVAAVFLTIPVWLAESNQTPPNRIAPEDKKEPRHWPAWFLLVLGCGAFVATFTAMNWGLYNNLLLPHGDSAMYEEHIWNLTHGKGFRSYLDQGLFLGEHIQVVHLMLTPFHMLWPSQLMMELCESLALGLCAVPIFLIARRHSSSPMAAALLGLAWLFYFPMHYLDIEIDFKTFRPICFGVPAMLFAIDQWERKRFKTATLLFLVTLSAKEDYALVLAPLLLYLGFAADESKERRIGLAGCGLTVVYLLVVVQHVIPAFRDGAPAHYARYFGELGSSPAEIVKTAITDPIQITDRLLRARSVLYSVLLLLPLGFLPLLSFKRLLVAVPVLGMLYLIELGDGEPLIPFHHFHATVLPILWWAAGCALKRFRTEQTPARVSVAAGFACFSALTTGLFYSMSPLGLGFHDPGSRKHWRGLYVVNERAEQVQKVLTEIPQDARVASTDFVHTRLTHRERSYDYSGYRTVVPDDADYIVIDAKHPWPGYSMAATVEEVREMKNEPDNWALIPIDTNGYFIVLKRRQ